ncbi:MAG TPA: hypothetical protein VLG69_05300 [Candidatus Andersenbacteria bacterium]|nr:hypothetical protein [Candidatus Andersenbacteria bacterium]
MESPQFPHQSEPEHISAPEENQERIRDRVESPHVEAVLQIFENRYKKTEAPVEVETIKDIFYTFFEQAVENSEIYSSEKFGVSFPYTKVNIEDLARELYCHYREVPKKIEPSEKSSLEFVLGSFIQPGNGNQFTFFEEAMHQMVLKLPRALEAIHNGQAPEDAKVFVVGSPTNEYGKMSQEFINLLKEKNSFNTFGSLYAEFIESKLPKDEKELANTQLRLYGISMGGSFATQTAEQLLALGKVTQEVDKDNKRLKDSNVPFMQVRADTLPGASTSTAKKWEIPIGFLLDGPFTLATNPYTRVAVTKEGKAMKELEKILAEKGINRNMDSDQARMKMEAIYGDGIASGEWGVINSLRQGIPIDPNLKLTEVRAKYDPLQFSPQFLAHLKDKKAKAPGSLAQNTVSASENWRRVGINQAHTFVFFRENELKRIEGAAKGLEKIKKMK